METFFQILRITHIVAGTIAFLVAPAVLIMKKGGRTHRLWGKVFFYAMTVVCLMAVIMAPMHKNLFLLMVGIFSFYLAFTGYRAVFRKNSYKGEKTAAIDWFFAILNTLFSFGLFILGTTQTDTPFGIIAMVFGGIGTWLGGKNIYQFIRPSGNKHSWLFYHMNGMITAYIAAVSAFSAVNMGFLPTVLQWLWPTLIGIPLLSIWMRKYKMKLSGGTKISELVEYRENNT